MEHRAVHDLATFAAKKRAAQKITMLTCYDYPTAVLQDEAGIDIIFVGDSVGTNVLGYQSEREVTMADMLHHLRAVRRGVQRAYLLCDLPYNAYTTPALALQNAQRLLDQGADGVKLEGGREQVAVVRTLADHGIDVCGHIGYTPQTLSAIGKKAKVQGRTFERAATLIDDALALEAAGLQMIVLELVPDQLSRLITQRLHIPTIGIGAGAGCDGQVLVINDVLGITPFQTRLSKHYQQYRTLTAEAIAAYKREVEAQQFPAPEHAWSMDDAELARVQQWINGRQKDESRRIKGQDKHIED
jgi:3-methyl-2-oxobutanoate hydroxymethyltransferase